MPHIGLRITKNLFKEINEIALKENTSKSSILRTALENYVLDHYIMANNIDWKPMAWQLFGLDIIKINYALARAKTPEEFFSYLDHWSKVYRITSFIPHPDEVKLRIVNNEGFNTIVSTPRENSMAQIISQLVYQINEALMLYVMENDD